MQVRVGSILREIGSVLSHKREQKRIGAEFFGEGFEQREIPVDEGDLYVSYWHSGDDYFLHTEDEFEEYLSQLPGMRFGG